MPQTPKSLFLEIFPRPAWVENVTCGGMCGTQGASHCGSLGANACNTAECDEEGKCSAPAAAADIPPIPAQYRDLVEVWTADYSDAQAIDTSLARLNEALAASHVPLMVTPDTFALFMSQAAPVVVINGGLAFTGMSPTDEQFARALTSALEKP